MTLDTLIKNVRVVRPGGSGAETLDVGIAGGRFAELAPDIDPAGANEVVDGKNRLAFPGLVDVHTHVGIYSPLADDDATDGLLNKGDIAPGYDADVLFDPDESFVVRAAESESAQGYTPFEGVELNGRVKSTYLRGELVSDDGNVVGRARGKYQPRPSRLPG